jgi:hypothetical protein
MSENARLLEPSFADAITVIEAARELSEQNRRHWVCSLRQIAKWLDRPAELIPARWTAIRLPVNQIHHARVGVTAKTVSNHKANVSAALRWFGKEHDMPARGTPLAQEWSRLRDGVEDRGVRARLYGLMRYCSGRHINPSLVDDAILDAYLRYRAETTFLSTNDAARRSVARSWNACIGQVEGWPARRLAEPPVKAKEGPAWEDFPEGLRQEIEAYLSGLQKPHRSASGKRIRPCSPSTIRVRRAVLAAVSRKAVEIGVPIESLASLAALLNPDVAGRVIEAYWEENGEEPKIFTIELGSNLLRVARATGCLDADAIERLDEIRATLEDGGEGMTVIPEGSDAPRLPAALSQAGFPFSKATLATIGDAQLGSKPASCPRVSEAGVTSETTIGVTADNCGIVVVVVLTGIKGPF